MEKATIFAYPQSDHELPHWKCVLRCCENFPNVNLPDQEIYDQYSSTIPSIIFHINHIISCCSTHGRLLLTEKNCRKCKQYPSSEQPTKIYTGKELVMMEKTISNSPTSFYIPEIHKLAFHITHVQILGTNNCGDSFRTSFKRSK